MKLSVDKHIDRALLIINSRLAIITPMMQRLQIEYEDLLNKRARLNYNSDPNKETIIINGPKPAKHIDVTKVVKYTALHPHTIELAKELPEIFTAKDISNKILLTNPYGCIAAWKRKNWIETLSFQTYKKLPEFGK